MAQEANDSESNDCNIVGLWGILIQIALGVLSFSVLIVKRYRQKPKRPWKIWIFDTSKQIFSQLLAHFINLTISIALTYNDQTSDECLWYFLTNILDNTIGVLMCILALRLIQKSFQKKLQFQYISGNYYEKRKVSEQKKEQENSNIQSPILKQNYKQKKMVELVQEAQNKIDEIQMVQIEQRSKNNEQPIDNSNIKQLSQHQQDPQKQQKQQDQEYTYSINYKGWLIQLLVWNAVVVLAKSILFGIQIGLEGPLKDFIFITMGWIQSIPILELVVVIVIVPVIMNGFAFWVQDNFLKKKDRAQNQQPLMEEGNKKQIKSEII